MQRKTVVISGLLLFAGLIAIVVLIVRRLLAFPISAFDVDGAMSDAAIIPNQLPGNRSFRMGFVYQPFAWNDAAFEHPG